MKRWRVVPFLPCLMAVAALVMSACALHEQREMRKLARECRVFLESEETTVDDIEGVRARVERLWEALGRPEHAASPEAAR